MRGRSLVWVVLALLAGAAVAWRLRPAGAPAGVDDVPAAESSGRPAAAAGLRGRAGAAIPQGPPVALLPEDAQPRPFSTGPLRVRVTVEDEPRAGMTVRVRAVDDLQPVSTAKTDASGIARFGAVDRARVVVEALADGYRPTSTESEGFEEEDGVLTLTLEPGLRVAGRVVEAETGDPLRGASVVVRISSRAFEIGPTDEGGRFVAPGLPEGSAAEIVARAVGRAAATTSVSLSEGRADPAEPVLRLARGAALAGLVRSPEGPMPGAVVCLMAKTGTPVPSPDPPSASDALPDLDSLDRLEALRLEAQHAGLVQPEETEVLCGTSRDDGRFRVDGLALGKDYVVRLHLPGYVPVNPALEVHTPGEGDAAPVTIAVRRAAVVRLRVHTPPNRPLPLDARVRLIHAQGSSPPAADAYDGEFLFPEAPPGPVAAHVHARGFRSASTRGLAMEGGTLELSLVLESRGTIAGVVVDGDGRPLSGAVVEIGRPRAATRSPRPPGVERESSELTDGEGRFEFWNPPDDATSLAARWAASDESTVLRTREPLSVRAPLTGLRVVLQPRGSVRCRLVTPQGGRFDGPAWAELHVEPWFSRRVTASQGELRTFDLHDAEYDVLIVSAGWAWMRRVVTIRNGGPVDLGDLVLDAGVSVLGRVLDTAGQPVEGALVRLPIVDPDFAFHMDSHRTPEGSAWTDADGRFRLEHVPRGEPLELEVWATGYTTGRANGVGGAAAPLEVRIQREALLTGEVNGPEDIDVKGLSFELRPAGAKPVRVSPDVDGEVPEELVEGAKRVWVDENGRFAAWVPPGRWIAIWTDRAQVVHTVGEWNLAAGVVLETVVQLPGR